MGLVSFWLSAHDGVTLTPVRSTNMCSPNFPTIATSFWLELNYNGLGSDPSEMVSAFIFSLPAKMSSKPPIKS